MHNFIETHFVVALSMFYAVWKADNAQFCSESKRSDWKYNITNIKYMTHEMVEHEWVFGIVGIFSILKTIA